MSNMFVLTNYTCGGKTSLLPALKVILSSKFPDKEIITIREPVRYLLEDVEQVLQNEINPKQDFNFYQRQASFLATALAQYDIVKDYIYNEKYIIIFDRCFIDVFIYLYLHEDDNNFIERKEKFLDILGLNKIDFMFDINFFYMNLPKKDEILQECFEDNTRNYTIDISTVREYDQEFYHKYCLFVEHEIPKFTHPADNSYVVYEMADEIIRRL